jgi:hypothetical protein
MPAIVLCGPLYLEINLGLAVLCSYGKGNISLSDKEEG